MSLLKALKLGKLLTKPYKAQMDWYRVPQSQFDWSHATINKEVANLDRREPDNMSIPLGHIHRMEFDTRALMLIGSFLDL